MKCSDLNLFLRSLITASDLHDLINGEVEEYKKSTFIKGKSVPITLIENEYIEIGKIEIFRLLIAYIDNELTKYEIAYIIDGLLLSEKVKFDNDELIELIEGFADIEVNGEITKDEASKILLKLS